MRTIAAIVSLRRSRRLHGVRAAGETGSRAETGYGAKDTLLDGPWARRRCGRRRAGSGRRERRQGGCRRRSGQFQPNSIRGLQRQRRQRHSRRGAAHARAAKGRGRWARRLAGALPSGCRGRPRRHAADEICRTRLRPFPLQHGRAIKRKRRSLPFAETPKPCFSSQRFPAGNPDRHRSGPAPSSEAPRSCRAGSGIPPAPSP